MQLNDKLFTWNIKILSYKAKQGHRVKLMAHDIWSKVYPIQNVNDNDNVLDQICEHYL